MMERLSIGIVLAALGAANLTSAQQPPALTQQTQNIKRIPLQKFEVPGTDFETVIGMAEIVPNVNIGRHTHPGPESGYMVEGRWLLVQGQPDKTVKVGDSYQVPSGPFTTPRQDRRAQS
jgi:quercetin dioxygenase-like cupin family protein